MLLLRHSYVHILTYRLPQPEKLRAQEELEDNNALPTVPVLQNGQSNRFLRVTERRLRAAVVRFLDSVAIQSVSVLCVLLTLFLSDAVTATSSSPDHQGELAPSGRIVRAAGDCS